MTIHEWMNSSYDPNLLSTVIYSIVVIALGTILTATGYFIYAKIKKMGFMTTKRYFLILALGLIIITFSALSIKWIYFTRLDTSNVSFDFVNICSVACVHVDLTDGEAETLKSEFDRLYFGKDNDLLMIEWTTYSETAHFHFGEIEVVYAHLDFHEWETWKMAFKVDEQWYVRNEENKISAIFDELLLQYAYQLQND